ncbi:hypothetical protein HZB03_03000 [Candidatus Woesearchaeota archaeon]|nr:hypothetical protein [Candidatus Woesearchaeota archaeon]
MGYTVIAPVGDNLKALFVGIKEFATEKVVLIAPSSKLNEARDLSKKLKDLTIEAKIIEINGNVMEEMFRVFGELCSSYNYENIIVNVATGDRMSTCAALSAAFANGLRAFGVMENKTMMMPIMRLSYYQEISNNKLDILSRIGNEYISLSDLSKKMRMSLALLSYHINGTYKSKGLKYFQLVELKQNGKNMLIRLSTIGKLLLNGYIK